MLRVAAAAAVLLLLLVLAASWLLYSAGGRDWALARVQSALPDLELRWQRAEGRLTGPLQLYGLSVHGEGFSIELSELGLALRPWSLMRGHLVITHLLLTSGRVELVPTDAPAPAPEPFRWPDDLPQLALPLTVELERLRLTDLTVAVADGTGLHLSDLDMRLTLGRDRLVVHALTLDSEPGRLELAGQWQSGPTPGLDLTGRFRPGHEQGQGSELRLRAIGSASALELELEGRAPEPLHLMLRITDADSAPRWSLTGNSQGFEPRALIAGASGRYAGQLQATGQSGAGELSGELDLDGFALVVEPSQWRFEAGRLELDALRLGVLDGRLVVTGPIETGLFGTAPAGAGAPPRFDLALQAQALRWGADSNPTELREAAGSLTGALGDWQLLAQGRLWRDSQSAQFSLDAGGSQSRAEVRQLRLVTALGQAIATGELDWRPALRWQARIELDRIDPAYLVPGYPGQLSGRIDSRGAMPEAAGGDPDIEATLVDLRGRLRGRPVSGSGELTLHGGQGQARLALAIGDSLFAAEGRLAPTLDLALTLERLRLSDLLADAQGTASGHARVRGRWQQPDIEADLRGFGLAIGGLGAEQIELVGRLPASGSGSLTLRGQDLDLAGVPAATLGVSAQGNLNELVLDAEIIDPRWRLSARSNARALSVGGWSGQLQQLRLALPEPGTSTGALAPSAQGWTLAQPLDWQVSDSSLRLSPGCLHRAPASLCLEADWPDRLTVTGRALPLALTEPWLNRDGGLLGGGPVSAEGAVELDLTLRRTGTANSGTLALRSGPAQWLQKPTGEDDRVLFNYLDLTLDATLADARIDSNLILRRADDGGLSARLESGLAPDAPLTGVVDLNIKDLAWLELLSPDLVQPRGRLEGRVTLAGSREAPVLTGDIQLHQFSGELPVLGIALRDSQLRLSGAGTERLDLTGRLDSGEGALALSGALALDGSQPRLALKVTGERFVAIDNPELRLVVSPDLDISFGEHWIVLRGGIMIPEAQVNLERIESGAGVSPDVVVLDPDRELEGRSLPVDADLRIDLGRQVALSGFGLDGRLSGGLRIGQTPGRDALASGSLEVSGNYTAFDTVLEIARGRLSYANAPLDDPTLDIRAERRFDTQTVGVRVLGSARNPRTTLVSEPSLDSTETLSWLVLGRPLRSAGSDSDSAQLGAAAMALGAGGNLLAQQIGARVGLELAVDDSASLGGSAFTVGKYLSPRLLVSYGVSLLGNGQVVAVSYQLRDNLEVEVESGLEQSAALRWKTER